MVLKKFLFDSVFALDTGISTGVLCATGGQKWLKVGCIEQLAAKG
jgi:hypothetical protein